MQNLMLFARLIVRRVFEQLKLLLVGQLIELLFARLAGPPVEPLAERRFEPLFLELKLISIQFFIRLFTQDQGRVVTITPLPFFCVMS